MNEEYALNTPEAVPITFELAGIGTRFLAAAIDALAIVGLLTLVALGSVLLDSLGGVWSTVATILGLTLGFLIFWGYYIVYESIWSGQTPGKRAVDIRVVQTSGYPIGFIAAVVRNIIRIVDFLPSLYGVGVVVMFVSTDSRRLGDYAAGTIVVKEGRRFGVRDLQPAVAPGHPPDITHSPVATFPARGALDPDENEWNLRGLQPRELVLVREYLQRADSLPPEARHRIGLEVSRVVVQRIGARDPLDGTHFLRRVMELYGLEIGAV